MEIKQLLNSNEFYKQMGLIEPKLLREIAKIDPGYPVNCKVKGAYGDRKAPLTLEAQQVLNGEGLKEGEFITQVW